MAHSKVKYWLNEEGGIANVDEIGRVWCLGDQEHFSMSWEHCAEMILHGTIEGNYAGIGGRGGWCEDCLRKLGLIW